MKFECFNFVQIDTLCRTFKGKKKKNHEKKVNMILGGILTISCILPDLSISFQKYGKVVQASFGQKCLNIIDHRYLCGLFISILLFIKKARIEAKLVRCLSCTGSLRVRLTARKTPTWVTGPQYLSSHLLPPSVCICRKVDWKPSSQNLNQVLLVDELTAALECLPLMLLFKRRKTCSPPEPMNSGT